MDCLSQGDLSDADPFTSFTAALLAFVFLGVHEFMVLSPSLVNCPTQEDSQKATQSEHSGDYHQCEEIHVAAPSDTTASLPVYLPMI